MMSFKLGKEIEKDVFHLFTSVGQKKFWVPMRNQTSGLWILHSDAVLLSHRYATVSEVYYEVHMTCPAAYTVRISNVDSVIFVNRIGEMVSFEFVPHSWKNKKHLSLKFISLKIVQWTIFVKQITENFDRSSQVTQR